MDKRFFLALLLTGAVVIATPLLFPRPQQPLPAATSSPSEPITAATTTPMAAIGPAAIRAGEAPRGPAVTPVPVVAAEARTIALSNTLATYAFSTRGASLLFAELPRYRQLGGRDETVRLANGRDPMLRFRLIAGGDTIALDQYAFTASQDEVEGRPRVTFSTAVGAGAVRIAYAISDSNYLTDVSVSAEGLPAPAFLLTDLPSGFDSQERDSTEDRRHLAYAMRTIAAGAERIDFRKPDPGERLVRSGPFTWAVAKNKYFLMGLLARDSLASPLAELHVTGAARVNKVAVRAEATVISPLGPEGVVFQLYAGPQEWERLVALGREFEHTNPYGGWISGIVQPFATIVMRVLLWMKRTLGIEYGLILVIFGVSIRLAMWPLNSRMMRSSIQMQRISPLVQAAQNKYKNDPEKQREAVMKVYSEAGISPFAPLAGCLPMLLPMPILFALFFVFQNTIEFRGVPFLWLPDISAADPYYIVPLVMGASMFLLSWIGTRNVPPNPQTKMMMYMMPIMMTVFLFNFASGLNLYYAVQNIAALPQQWLIANERGKTPAVAVVATEGERKKR